MVFAIALVVAGIVAWWLARGCVVTRVGAVGAVLGGVLSLGGLVLLIDPDAAFRTSATVTIAAGTWLFAFAIAGAVRGQRIERAERAAASAAAETRSRQRETSRV
ncbi:hypothetical protein GCM10009739_22050 [Microbacterium ulmi]